MSILATREKDNQRRTEVFLARRYFLRFSLIIILGKK